MGAPAIEFPEDAAPLIARALRILAREREGTLEEIARAEELAECLDIPNEIHEARINLAFSAFMELRVTGFVGGQEKFYREIFKAGYEAGQNEKP